MKELKKSKFYSELEQLVMELTNPLFLVSQNWKKYFQMNTFVGFIPEIHIFYVGPNSKT